MAFDQQADKPDDATQETAQAAQPAATPLELVEQTLVLTEQEQDALNVALEEGRRVQMWGAAVYRLLAKIATLPALSAQEREALPRPTYQSLLSQPRRHAGRAIRATVQILYARELVAGTPQFAATVDVPQGTKVWQMDGYFYGAADKPQGPIRVLSVADPMEVLGRNREWKDDEWAFGIPAPKAELTGVFYKVWDSTSRTAEGESKTGRRGPIIVVSTKTTPYPVVLAWQVDPPQLDTSSGGNMMVMGGVLAMMAGVVLLVLVFYFINRQVRQRRRDARQDPTHWWGQYRPLRDTSQDTQPGQDPEQDDAIDPAVLAASEAYRRQRALEEGDA